MSDWKVGMFQTRFRNYTNDALRAALRGLEEARNLRVSQFGTESLLLGLIHEEGLARKALLRAGLKIEAVKIEAAKISGVNTAEVGLEEIPFTTRCKEVLDGAAELSKHYGQSTVDTDHLLLTLLNEPDEGICDLLKALHVDLNVLRESLPKVETQ